MSDDKPSEAPRREQWSAEDRRILVITIAGGLAANLGTVLIVGLGLAYLHHQRSKGVSAPAVVGAAGILAVISAAVLVPVIIFRIRGETAKRDRWVRWVAWSLAAVLSALVLLFLFALVGVAAGVK